MTASQVDEGFARIPDILGQRPAVEFSGNETEILELHDRLEEIRLERAVTEAQISRSKGEIACPAFWFTQEENSPPL